AVGIVAGPWPAEEDEQATLVAGIGVGRVPGAHVVPVHVASRVEDAALRVDVALRRRGTPRPERVLEKPGQAVWVWRRAHLPFRLKTAQPSGSGTSKKGLPRRVTLPRASGGFRSRHDSRHVSSAMTNL